MANNEVIDGTLTVGNLTLASSASQIKSNKGTANATVSTQSANSATLNASAGVVTSASLTAAAASIFTMTITNSVVSATDLVIASVGNGTNSAAGYVMGQVTPGAGVVTITVLTATAALNGSLVFSFLDLK